MNDDSKKQKVNNTTATTRSKAAQVGNEQTATILLPIKNASEKGINKQKEAISNPNQYFLLFALGST